MSQRTEFCILATKPGSNISDLCRRYSITRRTGYKWIKRYLENGLTGLLDKSRRPAYFPRKTSQGIEEYVINLRKNEVEWGSKKLHKIICNHKEKKLYPFSIVPSRSTINKILKRNGLIDPNRSKQSGGFERFEYDYPNELWQMDFKGYFRLLNRELCHPLTIVDDHSRFNICLEACENQLEITVRKTLINVFRKYGLPYKILTDNGSPWGPSGKESEERPHVYTELEKWLIQLNVKLIHGRPYHPQTQGKDERFHRTLKQELIDHEQFHDIIHCQKRFNLWRDKYNFIRPHEAINLKTPSDLYTPSIRHYPEKIYPFEYNQTDLKRKVQAKGEISFKSKEIKVGKAFVGEYVALRETQKSNIYEVYFYNQLIRIITL